MMLFQLINATQNASSLSLRWCLHSIGADQIVENQCLDPRLEMCSFWKLYLIYKSYALGLWAFRRTILS